MPEFELGTFTVGALLGIFLGAFLGHALAIRRGKFQVKHNAIINLKKHYIPLILKIKNGDNPTIICSAYFDRQQEATLDYSAHLEGSDLDKFNEAINEYKSWYRIVCNRAASEVMYGENDPIFLENRDKDPVALMERILKHAST